MPLDPQVKTLLDQRAANGGRPVAMTARGPEVQKVEDRTIEGPGAALPVRIYTPSGRGPFPALVWLHGGGWTGGSVESVDSQSRHLCVGAGCVVVSVEYRLAPQHKFPAAAEDSYAAVKWIARNAAAHNVDAGRIAVGGTSAGGNLAAVVALMARDRHEPQLVCQVLIYPVTNRDFTTKSYQEYGKGEYGLSLTGMESAWSQYLGGPADAKNPYAAPLQAASLQGLPRALVQVGEYDPLRDECDAYTDRLKQAGVPVKSTRYPGLTHGYFGQWSVVDKAREAIVETCSFLKESFAAKGVAQAKRS